MGKRAGQHRDTQCSRSLLRLRLFSSHRCQPKRFLSAVLRSLCSSKLLAILFYLCWLCRAGRKVSRRQLHSCIALFWAQYLRYGSFELPVPQQARPRRKLSWASHCHLLPNLHPGPDQTKCCNDLSFGYTSTYLDHWYRILKSQYPLCNRHSLRIPAGTGTWSSYRFLWAYSLWIRRKFHLTVVSLAWLRKLRKVCCCPRAFSTLWSLDDMCLRIDPRGFSRASRRSPRTLCPRSWACQTSSLTFRCRRGTWSPSRDADPLIFLSKLWFRTDGWLCSQSSPLHRCQTNRHLLPLSIQPEQQCLEYAWTWVACFWSHLCCCRSFLQISIGRICQTRWTRRPSAQPNHRSHQGRGLAKAL